MPKTDYLDDLVLQLRLLDVPGVKIGAILAEAESHLAESGETPEEAFGPVREYARQLAEREGVVLPKQSSSDNALVQFFASMTTKTWLTFGALLTFTFVGVTAIFNGLWGLSGSQTLFGLPPWVLIAAGVAMLALWLGYALRSGDPIVDPRTGRKVTFGADGHRKVDPASPNKEP